MEEWVTVKDAANIRQCSERNIIELIHKGELDAKKDGRRWLIFMDASEITSAESPQNAEMVSLLKAQLQEKDKLIENLQKQLEEMRQDAAEASHRHDTVIMQMTKLIEYHQQPFWRKLFSRKALPPKVDNNRKDETPMDVI